MVKIEQGKFYKTRDGRKVGPMKPYRFSMYPKEQWTDGTRTYWDCGTYGGKRPEGDIIYEWQDTQPAQGPIREVRRREIVPGQWGIVKLFSKGSVFIEAGLYTPEQLREAAHLFNQLAEVLEEQS